MKFIIKGSLKENIYNLIRQAGYRFQGRSQEKSELIFIRPLERGGYPRFHLYLKIENENLVFNLHLDQRKPIYKAAPAHAGTYEGGPVEKEAERIKQIFQK